MRYAFFTLILSGICLICACNPSDPAQSETPDGKTKANPSAAASPAPQSGAAENAELPPLPDDETPVSSPSVKAHWNKIAELENSLQSAANQKEALEKFKTVAGEVVSELEAILADAQATEYDVTQAAGQAFEILTLQLQLKNASVYDKIIALPEKVRLKGNTRLADELSLKLYEIKLAVSVENQDAAQFKTNFEQYIKQVEAAEGETLDSLFNLAPRIAHFSEFLDDTAVAPEIYSRLVSVLQTKTASYAQALAKQFSSQINRVSLPGKPLLMNGTGLDGKSFNAETFKGKILLVDFWATWCGPCVAEMQNIKKIYTQFHDKGFDVLGISLDETAGEVSDFIEKNEIPWTQALNAETVLEDGQTMAKYYGINAIPCLILIGRDGAVISVSARGEKLEKLISQQFESSAADSSNAPSETK